MNLFQLSFYILFKLKFISCATTFTTAATDTTTVAAAAASLEWLTYLMGGIFALVGIFLIAVIGYMIYVKFFKFKKPIIVAEQPNKSQNKHQSDPIIVKSMEPDVETNKMIQTIEENQSSRKSSARRLSSRSKTFKKASKTSVKTRSKSGLIEPVNNETNKKDRTFVISPTTIETEKSFHLPSIFQIRQSEPEENKVDVVSIKSTSTVISTKKDMEDSAVNSVPSSANSVDFNIFSTRIVPFQVAVTEKKESAKKSKKVLSPLPAKIFPISKRKRTASPANAVEVTSKFINTPNKLWYSINPQIDDHKFREIKNSRKYTIYAYNHAFDDFDHHKDSEA